MGRFLAGVTVGVAAMAGWGLSADCWVGPGRAVGPADRLAFEQLRRELAERSERDALEQLGELRARLRGERFGTLLTRPWVPPIPLSWEPAEPEPEREPKLPPLRFVDVDPADLIPAPAVPIPIPTKDQ